MKVGIFYNSFNNPAKFTNKVMLMDNFKAGVLSQGDEVVEYHGTDLPDQPLDAGFVLGYTLADNFRKKIINTLVGMNAHRVFVDSNILHYARPEHEWHRYSLNSVYPNGGIYFFDEMDETKWKRYSEWHGVELKPWRTAGDHILILCQRPGGWNMFGNSQERWLDEMIEQIRTLAPNPIRVRMHPGDGSRFEQIDKLKQRYGNKITISENANIKQDLENCWCVVGYNSTPNVVAAIEGVPVFVTDPAHSWAEEIAFTDLGNINNPPLPDRSHWANMIANIHWSNEEVKEGRLWSAIRQYILTSRS